MIIKITSCLLIIIFQFYLSEMSVSLASSCVGTHLKILRCCGFCKLRRSNNPILFKIHELYRLLILAYTSIYIIQECIYSFLVWIFIFNYVFKIWWLLEIKVHYILRQFSGYIRLGIHFTYMFFSGFLNENSWFLGKALSVILSIFFTKSFFLKNGMFFDYGFIPGNHRIIKIMMIDSFLDIFLELHNSSVELYYSSHI